MDVDMGFQVINLDWQCIDYRMENQNKRANYGTVVTVHIRGPVQMRCVVQVTGPENSV